MKKTDRDYLKDTVRAWLSVETPRTQVELEALTGINRRDVKRAVRELRLQGVKVCSSNRGYWLARDDAEVDRTRARLWHEIHERLELVYAMSNYSLEGQMTMLEEMMNKLEGA